MVTGGRRASRGRAYIAPEIGPIQLGALIAIVVAGLVIGVALMPPAPVYPDRQEFERSERQRYPADPYCDPEALRHVSASLQQRRSNECAHEGERFREEREERWQATVTASAAQQSAEYARRQAYVGAIGTAILIMALGASAWAARAAFDAARAADDTLVHAREAAEIELRAYVHSIIYSSVFPPEPLPGSMVFVQIGWQNLGDTPAINCVSEASGAFFDKEPPADFDFPDSPKGSYAELFSMGREQYMYSTQMPFALGEVMATAMTDRRLYVWGWIDYDDVFKRTPRRRTEFCVGGQLGVDADEKPSIIFKAYPRHTGMDDGCMRKPRLWPPD